jgi:hypothetical protein
MYRHAEADKMTFVSFTRKEGIAWKTGSYLELIHYLFKA